MTRPAGKIKIIIFYAAWKRSELNTHIFTKLVYYYRGYEGLYSNRILDARAIYKELFVHLIFNFPIQNMEESI